MSDPFARDLARLAAGSGPPQVYVVGHRGGDVWTVGPLLGERAQITRGTIREHELGTYAEGWHYDSPRTAIDALERHLVDPASAEPQGWLRHIPSNRRRPDGDPAREEIGP